MIFGNYVLQVVIITTQCLLEAAKYPFFESESLEEKKCICDMISVSFPVSVLFSCVLMVHECCPPAAHRDSPGPGAVSGLVRGGTDGVEDTHFPLGAPACVSDSFSSQPMRVKDIHSLPLDIG